MIYLDNWDKLKSLWKLDKTDELEKEILEIGWENFWRHYSLQEQISKKHQGFLASVGSLNKSADSFVKSGGLNVLKK